jgi:predicted nucleic acid-binding protein
MLIVADTGPLISLAVIGKLDLLNALFYRTVIPQAVWNEIESKKKGLVPALRPLFSELLVKNRYFAVPLLDRILTANGEAGL